MKTNLSNNMSSKMNQNDKKMKKIKIPQWLGNPVSLGHHLLQDTQKHIRKYKITIDDMTCEYLSSNSLQPSTRLTRKQNL